MSRWAWGVVLVAGCAGDGPSGDSGSSASTCEEGDIEVTPGTGADEYVPLASGDPVILVHGPQGGWHIEGAGHLTNVGPEVTIEQRATVAELGGLELVGSQGPAFQALVGHDSATCEGRFWGVRGFLETAQGALSGQDFVCTLRDLTLHYEFTVSVGDRAGTAAVDVVAALDPRDVQTCDNPSLALGGGSGAGFVGLVSGGPLTVSHDPEEGWFVEVSGRVRRSGPDVTVYPRVAAPELGGMQLVGAAPAVAATLADHDPALGGEGTFAVRGLLDGTVGDDTVCGLDGRRLNYQVTVSEAGTGRSAVAEVEVVAVLDAVAATACAGR